MCGICGIVTPDVIGPDSRRLVEQMTATLRHRGPDDDGFYDGENVAFGHRRLSVVDLEHGAQPMTNEDGSVVVVYNGEIYNYAELRQELLRGGHTLATHCDAEVLPHLYEDFGPEMLHRLNGMFAFAVHDRRRGSLLLARDPVGIKPLYFAEHRSRFLFASEIKAILTDHSLPRVLDLQALSDYLSLLYALPPRTFFSHVKELEAGTYLVRRNGSTRVHRYWTPELSPRRISTSRAIEQFEALFDKILQDHLMADVPIGALLSGGIDSSLIVGTLSRRLNIRPPTFSVGFQDAAYDESPFATRVANYCGTDHRELRVPSSGADPELVMKVATHFDQPFADSSAIPSYLIAREIQKEMKVAFSGDGADELFGGYESYRRGIILYRLSQLPDWTLKAAERGASLFPVSERRRRVMKGLGLARLDPAELLIGMQAYMTHEEKSRLFVEDVTDRLRGYRTRDRYVPLNADGEDVFSRMVLLRLRYNLSADMLRKVDMMSMANGLEVRVPFLDRRLIEFALTLPRSAKLRWGRNKYLLRRVAQRLLPQEIARKPKWGFGIPLDTWAGDSFKRFLRDQLTGPEARLPGILRRQPVCELLDRFERPEDAAGRWSRYRVYQNVYQFLCLELWLRHWGVSRMDS